MWIIVDKTKGTTLMQQIYSQIKNLILNGNLISGEVLPSSRALSKELTVSRNTVLEAYNQLIAEGYLVGKHGSGTLVATGISEYQIPHFKSSTEIISSQSSVNNVLIDFRSGIPDLKLFPKKKWGKFYQNACDMLPETAFSYHSPMGVMKLRQTIANYLLRTRGINCNPNNIMIVSGSTQGLSLVSRLLYKKNKKVLIENPTHPGLMNVISNMGFTLCGIQADDYGLNTDLLKPSENISFIYTTPSHQYPLGGILPIQRRLSLIQYAVSNNCYIVEDDYDSEFRFEGQPVSSVYELNPQKVIYIGSFSKTVSPAIRLGYLVLPDELLSPYIKLKQYSDVHTEAITQYALSEFIEKGNFDKHVFKMKKLYAKKRQHLINELSHYFPESFDIKGQAAGLHLTVHFHNVTFTDELVNEIYLNNVKIYSIANYEFSNLGIHKNDILLGYAHLDFSDISKGINILSQIISSKA